MYESLFRRLRPSTDQAAHKHAQVHGQASCWPRGGPSCSVSGQERGREPERCGCAATQACKVRQSSNTLLPRVEPEGSSCAVVGCHAAERKRNTCVKLQTSSVSGVKLANKNPRAHGKDPLWYRLNKTFHDLSKFADLIDYDKMCENMFAVRMAFASNLLSTKSCREPIFPFS